MPDLFTPKNPRMRPDDRPPIIRIRVSTDRRLREVEDATGVPYTDLFDQCVHFALDRLDLPRRRPCDDCPLED